MNENVPPERRLSKEAGEGFCELVAYRLLEVLNDTGGIERLMRNNYTGGQIRLFVEAYRTYDFQRIVDWVQYGTNPQLLAHDPDRVRDVVMPRPRSTGPVYPPLSQGVRREPEQLTLRALIGSPDRRVALINDTALMQGESGRVLVGTNRVEVRCLEVRSDGASVEVTETQERLELRIEEKESVE
jgi:hypothetical protein